MPDYMTLGGPMPGSLGGCADLYHDLRELRLMKEKAAEAVAAREREVREHLIASLDKSRAEGGNTGAAGKRYRVQIKDKTVYTVKDWSIFHSWIRKNDRFDMLQKRLSDKAVADWVEEQKILADAQQDPTLARLLPGTEKVLVPEVSVTKI